MSNVSFRQARPEDYSAIVRLNAANFIANLSEEERRDGFLSAVFTLEQTAAMAEDLGTTVAIVDGQVAGFVCAFRNDFDHGSPVVAKMIESYERFNFDGKLLSTYKSYAYGPVCIDRAPECVAFAADTHRVIQNAQIGLVVLNQSLGALGGALCPGNRLGCHLSSGRIVCGFGALEPRSFQQSIKVGQCFD
jgi:hypothetical protein